MLSKVRIIIVAIAITYNSSYIRLISILITTALGCFSTMFRLAVEYIQVRTY
jgi:hypothetical protein